MKPSVSTRVGVGASGIAFVRPHPAADRPGNDRPGRPSDVPVEARRIGAKVVIPDGDEVLLLEESRSDGTTFWALPGGGRRPGETLRECLRREVQEELHCGLTLGDQVGTCTYRHTTRERTVSQYAVFVGSLDGCPSPAPAEGIVDVRWVTPDSPPTGTLAPFRAVLWKLAGGRLADEQPSGRRLLEP